jgi:hypothetical protein
MNLSNFKLKITMRNAFHLKIKKLKHFHDGSIMIRLKGQKFTIRDTIRISILAGWFVVKGQ